MRLALAVFLVFYSLSLHATITEYVVTDWSSGTTSIDYRVLHATSPISDIIVEQCASPPDDEGRCASAAVPQRLSVNARRSFRISTPGLHRAWFFSADRHPFLGTRKEVVWEQFVYNADVSSLDIQSLAHRYAPVVSFHDQERYFPVSIATIFNRPLSDFDDLSEGSDFDHEDLDSKTDTAAVFLRGNGHVAAELALRKDVAKTLTGSRDEFPIYWIHEKDGENRLWLTYIFLYAFDEKNYSSRFAEHSVDRESVSVLLQKDADGQWAPQEVVYAGHLASQPTTFLGCQDSSVCALAGDHNHQWEGGKTTVRWSQVSKLDQRPVVYVVHGSHAMNPAHGFYELDYGGFRPLQEPAGSPKIESYVSDYDLVHLDFSVEEHRALSFSGKLIKGLGGWYRVHPFVRVPVSQWSNENKNYVMDECIANTSDNCSDYIVHADSFVITDIVVPTVFVVNQWTEVFASWSGSPRFPVSILVANLNCAEGNSCISDVQTIGEGTVSFFESLDNPFASRLRCGGVSINRIGISLRDSDGIQTPFHPITVNCVNPLPVCTGFCETTL